MKCTPRLNAKYWTALVVASVFGANAGDYLADGLDLGHLKGLPVLAAVLAVIFGTEAFSKKPSFYYFWASIITIRAAATNVGDSFHDYKIDFVYSIPATFVVLLAVILLWQLVHKTLVSNGAIAVNGFYWVTMFLAGVLGTLVGDYVSYRLGLGNFGAMAGLGLGVAVMLWAGRSGLQTRLIYYWLTIAMIRSAGTAAGDLFAHHLGLGLCTAVTGAVFVALIVAFYGKPDTMIAIPAEQA